MLRTGAFIVALSLVGVAPGAVRAEGPARARIAKLNPMPAVRNASRWLGNRGTRFAQSFRAARAEFRTRRAVVKDSKKLQAVDKQARQPKYLDATYSRARQATHQAKDTAWNAVIGGMGAAHTFSGNLLLGIPLLTLGVSSEVSERGRARFAGHRAVVTRAASYASLRDQLSPETKAFAVKAIKADRLAKREAQKATIGRIRAEQKTLGYQKVDVRQMDRTLKALGDGI